MDDHFDYRELRIHQPGRLLPNRASYEIFDGQRHLVAVGSETAAHTRIKLLSKAMPDARVVAVTSAANEPLLTLVKHAKERVTDLLDADGERLGHIRATHTTRHYSLIDAQDQTVGKAVGDLALKHFEVTRPGGEVYARVRKTWAGLKEMVTPADHYKVEFVGSVSPSTRTLTVMLTIVLDLTLYGPM